MPISIDPDMLMELLLGPLGALVLAIGIILGLTRLKWLAPYSHVEKLEERNRLLDEENRAATKQRIEDARQIAALTVQVEELTKRIEEQRKDIQSLRMRLGE